MPEEAGTAKAVEIMRKQISLLILVASLAACVGSEPIYKAYLGEARDVMRVATLEGDRFLRQDLINRYVDSVRFLRVDEIQIENSKRFNSIQIDPGFRTVLVYFDWDLGSMRGLAPALVNYASYREQMSRVLSFDALAGEVYLVKAEPVFTESFEDITTMSHVDFWIEDQQGNEIVSREEGRYIPAQ